MNYLISVLWTLAFWFFVGVKVGGDAFAAWSWWWVILPWVPVIGEIAARQGF